MSIILIQVRPIPGETEENGLNIILYLGLGMLAIGLVITFVGMGEKGFRTVELKLVGPVLVGGGVVLALLRILLCIVSPCSARRSEQNCDFEHLLDDKQEILNSKDESEVIKINGIALKDQAIDCICEGGEVNRYQVLI